MTLLVSVTDTAAQIVKETLGKCGLDPSTSACAAHCLVKVNAERDRRREQADASTAAGKDRVTARAAPHEVVLNATDSPLAILLQDVQPSGGSAIFEIRQRTQTAQMAAYVPPPRVVEFYRHAVAQSQQLQRNLMNQQQQQQSQRQPIGQGPGPGIAPPRVPAPVFQQSASNYVPIQGPRVPPAQPPVRQPVPTTGFLASRPQGPPMPAPAASTQSLPQAVNNGTFDLPANMPFFVEVNIGARCNLLDILNILIVCVCEIPQHIYCTTRKRNMSTHLVTREFRWN